MDFRKVDRNEIERELETMTINWMQVLEVETYLNNQLNEKGGIMEKHLWRHPKAINQDVRVDKNKNYLFEQMHVYLSTKYPYDELIKGAKEAIKELFYACGSGHRICEIDQDLIENIERYQETSENSNIIKVKNSGWAELNLNSKIKTLRQIPYKVIEKDGQLIKGSIESNSLLSEQFEHNKYVLFNDLGNKVEEKRKDENNEVEEIFIYKYDKDKSEEHRHDANNNLEWKAVYKHDNYGLKTEGNWYDASGTLDLTANYKYDDYGNLIEWRMYYGNGKLNWILKYKYDGKGNIIEKTMYPQENNPAGRSLYKYDECNNMIEWAWYESDGSLFRKTIFKYEYNDEGDWIKQIQYRNDKAICIVERELTCFT